MSILINKETRVLVQGITGREGAFHTEKMLEYGTKIVAGSTPGKGGQVVAGDSCLQLCDRSSSQTRELMRALFLCLQPPHQMRRSRRHMRAFR